MPRELCPRCQRPVSVCYCAALESCAAPLQVVLLQTPEEARHSKNTGRIVQLGVAGCQTFVGEMFDDHAPLQQLLTRWRGRTWLLYPGEGESPASVVQRCSGYGQGLLLVIDGTWRKSRRMLHLNPWLKALPRVQLPVAGSSRYLIRKVPGEGYLSTVEALVACLQPMGHPAGSCEQMLSAFQTMIDHQVSFIGEALLAKNYSGRLPPGQQ